MWSIILCSYHYVNLMVDVGLILQGHLLPAVDFVSLHRDCLLDIALLSTVSFKLPLFFYLVNALPCRFDQISFKIHKMHACIFIKQIHKSIIRNKRL